MGFEVYEKQRQSVTDEPAVTLQKKGAFSLNASAFAALGHAEAVELLYDRDERCIAIRPVRLKSPNAYPVRPVAKGSKSYLVAGTAFAKYYGIELGEARRWIGQMHDGMLVLDMKQPPVNAGRGRVDPQVSARAAQLAMRAKQDPDGNDPDASPATAGAGREVP
jgi:hypothetical protein